MVSSSSDHQQGTSAQGAVGSPDPSCSYGEQWARGETRKRCFPEQTRIGAELGFPRRVSLSRMQLPEASFVPFLRWALVGPPIAGGMWGAGSSAHKAFSGPISFLPKGEHVWSWFPALAMTCKPPVHTEQEEAQTLLALMASNGLGGKPETAAFLIKHALGLSLVSRGEFHFRECSSQKLDLCLF